jgi:hypothetical protein
VANRNFAACNRVSGFGASEADLRLGGDDNTIVGFTGSVRDDGSGNQFIAGDCDEDASPGLSPTSKE